MIEPKPTETKGDPSKSDIDSVPKTLELVRAASPQVETEKTKYFELVSLRLPANNTLEGWIEYEKDGRRAYNPGMLKVNPTLRNNGIGERLLKAGIAFAKSQGATDMVAAIANDHSMRILRKIIPEELIRMYDYEHRVLNRDGKPFELPMGTDQAIQSLERARRHYLLNVEGDLEEAVGVDNELPTEIDIKIDLTQLDTSGWELPVESH